VGLEDDMGLLSLVYEVKVTGLLVIIRTHGKCFYLANNSANLYTFGTKKVNQLKKTI